MGDWAIGLSGAGGSFVDFDALGFIVAAPLGDKLPPMDLVTQPFATRDGADFQRTIARERPLTLRGWLRAATPAALRAARATLITYLRRDNADPQPPITLRYLPSGATAWYLDCYYDDGLSGGETDGFYESLALRFLATSPAWYRGSAAAAVSLDPGSSIGGALLRRTNATRLWDNLYAILPISGSERYAVTAIGVSPNGTIYVAAGTLIIRVSDGATVGTIAGSGAVVNCITAGVSAASIVIGGVFTSVSGVSAANVASYNGSAWSALGSGVSGGAVYAIASDGTYTYVAGAFTSAGGNSCKIGRYYANSNLWTAVDTPNGTVTGLLLTPDSATLYAAGAFTSFGSGITTSPYIAAYDTSTIGLLITPRAVGTGLPNAPLSDHPAAVTLAADGALWVGLSRWDGTLWQSMTNSISSTAPAVVHGSDGVTRAITLISTSSFAPAGMYASIGPGSEGRWALAEKIRTSNTYGRACMLESGGALYVALVVSASVITSATLGLSANCMVTSDSVAVTNTGAAAVAPVITLTAPTPLNTHEIAIENARTGAVIYLRLLRPWTGEVITIDCANRRVTSQRRGDLRGAVLNPSGLAQFTLLPGANNIRYVNTQYSASSPITLTYTPYGWSNDG